MPKKTLDAVYQNHFRTMVEAGGGKFVGIQEVQEVEEGDDLVLFNLVLFNAPSGSTLALKAADCNEANVKEKIERHMCQTRATRGQVEPMKPSTFEGVPDALVIALGQLRLQRAGLKLPCTTRAQAINILRSVKPAIPKTVALDKLIKAKPCVPDACRKCGKPIPFGSPCKVCFNGDVNEHIQCRTPSKKAHDKAIAKLFKEACEQVVVFTNQQGRRN